MSFFLELYSSASSCHCEQYICILISRSINPIDKIHNIWMKITIGLQFNSSMEIGNSWQNKKIWVFCMVTSRRLIPLYIRIKRTCHKISPRSQSCIRSISIRRRPLHVYRSDIKMAQLRFGNVKWSIRHRMVDVGIPSPRELNGMKSISMRHRSGQHHNADIELIKIVYSRQLFRFRSKYLTAVELSTSFQQPISIWCRMTDVEWAVESYLSISLATYLSEVVWLTSFRQRNYMVSISIRHPVLYRPYIIIPMSKRYHNGIFTSAPVLKSDFWHRMIDIMFSTELDRIYIIWYRPICRSSIALPLLQRYRNGVFSLIFANVVGWYLSNIEWSTWCRRGIPSYRYSSDVGQYIGLHSVADIRVMSK